MPLELSTDTFSDLLAHDTAGGMPVGDTRPWPAAVGRGTFACSEVRPGVVLYVLDLEPACEVSITAPSGPGYFEWGFHLRGHSEGAIDGIGEKIAGRPGMSEGLFAPRGHGGVVRFLPGHPVLTVAIGMAPGALLELFPTPEGLRTEQWLNGLVHQTPFIEVQRPMAAETAHLARQVVECPFAGRTRHLFLEAKVLELVAGEAASTPPTRSASMSHNDQRLVQAAASILERSLEAPPSLRGLARLVGTNELKLKQGFRTLFGTTVFGYLRRRRMERARHLLVHRELSVTEAAGLVGYACPSRFSAAFQRQFGTRPSALRPRH